MHISYVPKTHWDEIGRASAPGVGDSAGKFGTNQKGSSLYKLPPGLRCLHFWNTIEQGQWILDLGSGIGICVGRLTELGYKAVGCDISPILLNVARQNCLSHGISNPKFVQWDGYELPFQSNSFDRIIANAVLQHVIDENALNRFFNGTNRILKPQGQLIVCRSVFNLRVKSAPHVLLRPPKIYESMAIQNGLKIKTITRTFSSYALMRIIYRLASRSSYWKQEAMQNNEQNIKPKLFNAIKLFRKTGFSLSKMIDPILNRLRCNCLATQATMVFEKSG